jgi:glutamate-1-semialdehyde aminotransferase
MSLENNYEWWERAGDVLAGGFATLSKNPDRFAFGVGPIVLARGNGCYVTDVDGARFLDVIGALGPVIFGYGWENINEAVIRALRDFGGPSFSLGHFTEIEVGEMIAGNILAVDTVRFCKNGADATQAAVRVARSATNRRHILCSGYHGGHDWYISTTDKNGGVLPEAGRYTHQFTWGNVKQFDNLISMHGHDLAGVIVEVPPLAWDNTDQDQEITEFLEHLAEVASRWDAIFILDEVVTGFRYGLGGASAYYGVTPDLVCLGKGIANGWPLAAIGGDRNLMSEFNGGNVFLSTTNGGDVLSLAAARACISELEDGHHLTQLWDRGEQLGDGLSRIIEAYSLPVELIGNPARMVLKWSDHGSISGDAIKTLWLQETVSQGVLFGGPIFPTVIMSPQDIIKVLDASFAAACKISEILKTGDPVFMTNALRCPVIEDVFSKRYMAGGNLPSALSGV